MTCPPSDRIPSRAAPTAALVLWLVATASGCKQKDGGSPDGSTKETGTTEPPTCDVDEDGVEGCGGSDCDDQDASVHPGAADGVASSSSARVEGFDSALVYLPDGRIGVVSGGNAGVDYVEQGPSGTTVTHLADGYLYYVSAALDADGNPHAAWASGPTPGVFHAWREGTDWTVEEITDPQPSRADLGTSLRVGSDGTVHLVFEDKDLQRVAYHRKSGGTWAPVALPDEVAGGYLPSVALDAAGAVHLGYVSGPDVRYLTDASGSWVGEEVYAGRGVASGAGGATATDVAEDGTVRVAYLLDPYSPVASVAVSTRGSGGWNQERMPGSGAVGVALGFDEAGRPTVGWTALREHGLVALGRASGPSSVDEHVIDWDWVPGFTLGAGSAAAAMPAMVKGDPYVGELHVLVSDFPDGVDQDCDGAADARSGQDPAARPADLAAEAAQALCDWGQALTADVPAAHCAPVVEDAACPDALAAFPTVAAFEDCRRAVDQGQCDWSDLPAACATTPDLDGTAAFGTLTAADADEYCAWSSNVLGGAGRVYTCDGGTTTIATAADCAADVPLFAPCTLTVSEQVDCTLALARDPCDGLASPRCQPLAECLAQLY